MFDCRRSAYGWWFSLNASVILDRSVALGWPTRSREHVLGPQASADRGHDSKRLCNNAPFAHLCAAPFILWLPVIYSRTLWRTYLPAFPPIDKCHGLFRSTKHAAPNSAPSCAAHLPVVVARVGRAIGRNGNYASAIRDPESYLLVAFRGRFGEPREHDQSGKRLKMLSGTNLTAAMM